MEMSVSRTLSSSDFGILTRLYGLTGFDCHAGVGLWDTRSGSVLTEVVGTATFGMGSLGVPLGFLLETFPGVVMVIWYYKYVSSNGASE